MATQWTGGRHGLWTVADNWTDGVPAAGVEAVFDAAGSQDVALAPHLIAGALSIYDDSLTLHGGSLRLQEQNGARDNVTVQYFSSLTVSQGAALVAREVDVHQKSTLSVQGKVRAGTGDVRHSTLDISGLKAQWIFGSGGLAIRDSDFTLSDGARLDTGADGLQYPAATLDFEGNPTGLITGAQTSVRIANVTIATRYGHYALSVEDGAVVDTGIATLGHYSSLTVSGAGSRFNVSQSLSLDNIRGRSGTSLTIAQGGTVTVGHGGLTLFGTLTLDSTATLATPYIVSHAGTIIASSGTVTLDSKLFLRHAEARAVPLLRLEAAAGATLVLAGTIETHHATPDTAQVLQALEGHIVLSVAEPAFAGTTQIVAAALEISALGAAGAGGLAFVGGTDTASLRIDGGLAFDNVISGFSKADSIDLAGLNFSSDLSITYTESGGGGVLTVDGDGGQHMMLHFAGAGLSAVSFKLASDTHGGTLITHG